MKIINLTQGQETIVDDDDYRWLCQWKWHARFVNGKWRVAHKSRDLAAFLLSPDAQQVVDHIDGNGLNNQRANLRLCTQAENIQNQSGWKNASSTYVGVSWDKRHQKWMAQIMVKRKTIYLGYFINEIEAAKARDEGAMRYCGQFAKLNFPKGAKDAIHEK